MIKPRRNLSTPPTPFMDNSASCTHFSKIEKRQFGASGTNGLNQGSAYDTYRCISDTFVSVSEPAQNLYRINFSKMSRYKFGSVSIIVK